MSISGSLKPHGLCNMGFFDAFQQWAGENRAKRLRPIAQMKNEVQLELERRQAIAKQLHEQSFRDIAGELEKQRARAESFAQNPDQLLSVTEQVPSWNEADQLALYDAYKRSGIDREKQADSDQAVLAADAFKRGLANITNEAALVNIGMGNEYKPVELEGGVFYNPYDTQNFNLGSTEKHQAETKLEQAEAAEQTLRLERIRQLSDPLMQLNATSNKELGKPMEAKIEGPNGETHKALITQDSNGRYHHSTVTDKEGKPLVIPPEAVGSGSESPQMKLARDYLREGVVTSLAEGLKLAAFSKTDSPEAAFNNLFDSNKKDDNNMEIDQKERLQKTMIEFASRYPGLPIPGIEERIKRTVTDKNEQTELLTFAKALNSNLPVNPPPPPPPVVNQSTPTVTPTVSQPPVIPQGGSSAPVLDKLMNQWQAGQQPAPGLTLDQPPAAMPEPLPSPLEQAPFPPEPAQQLQPLTAQAINDAWQMINSGEDPKMVRNGLAMSGYDMSSQAIDRLTIDAINAGVPADLFQKYLASIGLAPTN